ncbi:hypothetical protein N431DRAFT_487352 [Stipitochalara longipes BDJ]|nr:hypothetical protein N431DRAFT_487352 [Stipitochalara longipes BDJ]
MSTRTKKDGIGGGAPTTPENARYTTSFNFLRRQDISRDIDGFSNTIRLRTPGSLGASPLQSWIHDYDNEKAASGRGTPSVGSAFARVTYTPATTPTSTRAKSWQPPSYDLISTGAKQKNSPEASQESPIPTPYKRPRYRLQLSSNEKGPALISSPPKVNPDPASLSTPPGYKLSPSRVRESPRSQAVPLHIPFSSTADARPSSPNASPTGKRLKLTWSESDSPVNAWDSASLTRYWTQDLVRTAIMRIMSELNLDFYEDHYRLLDFDGSQKIVQKLWEEIRFVYTEFLRSHVYGLDILTLIAMNERALNGGPLANINALLADMICFFAAGKIGMERRAENMAEALISGDDILKTRWMTFLQYYMPEIYSIDRFTRAQYQLVYDFIEDIATFAKSYKNDLPDHIAEAEKSAPKDSWMSPTSFEVWIEETWDFEVKW